MTTAADSGLRVVTLADIVGVVLHLKGYWIGGAVLGLAVALAVGFLTRPVYRATVVVMPVSNEEAGNAAVAGLLSRFGGAMGIGIGGRSQHDEALAVLKSRQFAQQIIAEENMMPLFFADQWDSAGGQWTETFFRRIPTDWDAWIYFDRKVRTVLEDQDRGLVTIRVEWFDPVLAARWANRMVALANDDLRARKLRQLESSLDFLQSELGKTHLVELRGAISQVMESQISERMLAKVSPEYAFRVIDAAVAPDLDQPERPKKLLLVVIGLTAGATFGMVFGLAIAYTRRHLASAQAG